jgi:hypothetical protein
LLWYPYPAANLFVTLAKANGQDSWNLLVQDAVKSYMLSVASPTISANNGSALRRLELKPGSNLVFANRLILVRI